MPVRLLFAALFACALTSLGLSPALAGNGGLPPGYEYGDRGYYPPPWPDDRYPAPYPYYRRSPPPYWGGDDVDEIVVWITCGQGKQILFDRGYYDVKTDNCRGPNYRYRAWREGRQFDIRMDASGEINRVRRID